MDLIERSRRLPRERRTTRPSLIAPAGLPDFSSQCRNPVNLPESPLRLKASRLGRMTFMPEQYQREPRRPAQRTSCPVILRRGGRAESPDTGALQRPNCDLPGTYRSADIACTLSPVREAVRSHSTWPQRQQQPGLLQHPSHRVKGAAQRIEYGLVFKLSGIVEMPPVLVRRRWQRRQRLPYQCPVRRRVETTVCIPQGTQRIELVGIEVTSPARCPSRCELRCALPSRVEAGS
jgi:hypothetical protein